MTTTVISNTYTNGQRVSTQEVTYDKSDDLFALANLQRQYESMCRQRDSAASGTDMTFVNNEITRLAAEIIAQQAIIDSYEPASE